MSDSGSRDGRGAPLFEDSQGEGRCVGIAAICVGSVHVAWGMPILRCL